MKTEPEQSPLGGLKTETVQPAHDGNPGSGGYQPTSAGVRPAKASLDAKAKPEDDAIPLSGKRQNSALRWTRLQTLLLAGVLLVLLVTAAVLGRELGSLHRSLELMEQKLTEVQMQQVNEAIDAMTEAANQLAAIDAEGLNQTAVSLRQAADRLTAMDVNTLNQAIASLRDAADTLKKLDIQAFNDVISSLDAASENLAKITGGIKTIFGG